MKCLFRKAALLIVFVSANLALRSQESLPIYEFGLNGGMMVYAGDLTPRDFGSFETQKFTLGLHASKILNPVLSVKANLAFGKLAGNDALYSTPEFRQQRNFNFSSPVTELTGQVVWNLTGSNYNEKGISPYVFAGAGISFLHIRRDWSGFNDAYFHDAPEIRAGLTADSAHSLPRILPVIPVGAGVKYFFHPNWGVNAEGSYRFTRSDYLDGFSQAANADKRDKYFSYTIGIIYRPFGGAGGAGGKNTLKCPVMKY